MIPLPLVSAISIPHTELMSEIAVVVGTVGILGAGCVSLYAMWRKRVAAAFRQVPVGTAGPAPVVRRGELPGHSR